MCHFVRQSRTNASHFHVLKKLFNNLMANLIHNRNAPLRMNSNVLSASSTVKSYVCFDTSFRHSLLPWIVIIYVGNNWIKISPTPWFTKVKMFPSAFSCTCQYVRLILACRESPFSRGSPFPALWKHIWQKVVSQIEIQSYLHNFVLS